MIIKYNTAELDAFYNEYELDNSFNIDDSNQSSEEQIIKIFKNLFNLH